MKFSQVREMISPDLYDLVSYELGESVHSLCIHSLNSFIHLIVHLKIFIHIKLCSLLCSYVNFINVTTKLECTYKYIWK